MPRGAKKGESRGGRPKGSKNKTTLEREAIARQAAAASDAVAMVKEDDAAPVVKLGKQILSEAANFFYSLAAKYQPRGPTPDEKKFEAYLLKAAGIAKELAPFESPKLAAVMIGQANTRKITVEGGLPTADSPPPPVPLPEPEDMDGFANGGSPNQAADVSPEAGGGVLRNKSA